MYECNLQFNDTFVKTYKCFIDHLNWIDSREKRLYEFLVQIVGSEIDIRKRQRLYIIQDRIVNSSGSTAKTQIFSGSLAEGLNLPGSDMDVMFVRNNYKVIHNPKNIKISKHRDSLYVIETDIDHPGFARLRMLSAGNGVSPQEQCGRCPPGTCTSTQFYLPVNNFLDLYMKSFLYMKKIIHGPCISDEQQTFDIAYCIRSKYFPKNAFPWASRHRRQWPPSYVIDRIKNCGCLLVPIGPKTGSDNHLWRISFSVAEKILVHSFSFTQLLCYGLLKLTLKRTINTHNSVKGLLCSYFLKTALFWVSEEVDIDKFQLSKIYHCFSLCLKIIIAWVKKCYCPNYFIPEQNMFLGKIDQSNNTILLCILESIQCGGVDGLIQHLFLHDNDHHCLLSTKSESSFILLDFLLYRNMTYMIDTIQSELLSYFKALSCIEYLLNSQLSSFIIDACKFYNDNISRKIVQLLPLPNAIGYKYNIRKCYHKYFERTIKTDAVSGWLLYASFYCVIGQFSGSLKITDYVLSKYSPDLMLINSTCVNMVRFRNIYKHNVDSSMTLHERLQKATAQYVNYMKQSSLAPEELRLEVEFDEISIIPNVIAHCLRFLCYHHLGDISNRQQALHDLYESVKNNIIETPNTVSNELTILGVCFEISGDKDMAYQCYDEALQCDEYVCPSAEIKKIKTL
ncbi:Hypothetical predicted protein [Mytilus galloprovincialis]|uniref:Mab-21-like HhH/H2TH-like domain-containing protein n=1 Tax=Mytilus galloprovincialis TaxID=29158 RepID=A0A8B6EH06_MYTGA|nr:Hypothetical predicted protein [Mytilus galloprovincialis]